MKLMSYNILDGGGDRLSFITAAIKEQSPDCLVINEANNFAKNDKKIIKNFSNEVSLPHHEIVSTEYGYDVAIFSKYPFKKIVTIMPLKRAATAVEIDSKYGPISIVGLHLSPDSEDERCPEIESIIASQKEYKNRILMGDMNSLSREDKYDPAIIEDFNDKQKKKFTREGKFCFDVVDKVLSSEYRDTAVILGKNSENTVPTPTNKDNAHSKLRLDYIFISDSLISNLVKYKVVKNVLTDKASDHYPVTMTLE